MTHTLYLTSSNQTSSHQHQHHQLTHPPSEKRDLAQLSSLGHFLKGSSATLGMTKVKDSCKKIQKCGANKRPDGSKDVPDDDECLDNLKKIIKQAKGEFAEVEKRLRQFYEPGSA
jgi:osomolarity two-component system phosphorelay intermediate protein YPD1